LSASSASAEAPAPAPLPAPPSPPPATSLSPRPERDARAQLLSRVLLRFLTGVNVIKHGRRGWPHARLLWLDTTGAELMFRWGRREHGLSFAIASESVMRLGAVRGVGVGRTTPVLLRSGSARREHLYWSLIDSERGSLDLEAASGEQAERDELAAGARRMIEDSGAMQAELMRLFQSGEWVPEHLKRTAHARNQDGSEVEDDD
jgi:hypothetical protein